MRFDNLKWVTKNTTIPFQQTLHNKKLQILHDKKQAGRPDGWSIVANRKTLFVNTLLN